MLVHRRVTPSIKFTGTHLYTRVERGTVRVKCLAQEHNTMSPARARTRTARSGDERTNHEATTPHHGKERSHKLARLSQSFDSPEGRLDLHTHGNFCLFYYWIVSTTAKFTCNNKGLPSMFSCSSHNESIIVHSPRRKHHGGSIFVRICIFLCLPCWWSVLGCFSLPFSIHPQSGCEDVQRLGVLSPT